MDDRMPPAAAVPAALPAYPPRIRVLARPGRRAGAETLAFCWWLDDAAPGDFLILTDGLHEWAAMIEDANAHLLHTTDGLTFHRANGALLTH